MNKLRLGESRYKNLPAHLLAALVSLALPATAWSAELIEEVVVTGSRIPTDPNLVSSVPVQAIGEREIQTSGELNLADVVNDIPALISSLTAENSDTGANALNLRGLGGERTLTLVNGRRHVAGFRGTQAVDIGSIPRALVKSVEVTTGGASAIYGSDAVTGVVNFILKDDFEGVNLDVRGAVPDDSGGDNYAFDLVFGRNFQEGRGNVVLAITAEEDNTITYGQRSWSRNNGISSTAPNANPDPNGPPKAMIDDPRFWLTSQEGSIAPGFGGRSVTYVDINQNGIADCQESEGGRVGYLAGCWITLPDGSVAVNTDGIVLNGLWGIGGDGGRVSFDRDSLMPETDKMVVNLNAKWAFSDNLTGFFEGKYVEAESTTFFEQDTFYDTLEITPDNPFIPTALRPVIDQTGYLLLTQDPLDFSDDNPSTYTRKTTRFVVGLDWQINDDHRMEFAVNQGKFKREDDTTGLYLDRVYAAIDTVLGPGGVPVCRSDLDPTAFYPIDYFTASGGYANGDYYSDRYYTFTPGDGQCQPLNPFGTYSASKAAQAFVTAPLHDELEMEQTVVSIIASGQFEFLSSILDGPIGYAAGIEYRDESSDNRLDPLTLGILPEGSSLTPGVAVNDIDDWIYSFTSIDNEQQFNTSGGYDVTDVFLEFRLPLLQGRPLAKDLTLDGAVRQADYSTLGEATTWKVGGTWSPVDMLSFRATVSEAVRAPNISELYDPKLPIFISATADPCAEGNVANGTAERQANCVASLQSAGLAVDDILDANGNYIWVNPLSGRFSGVSGGNPNLGVETAETTTFGLVVQPLDGLAITVDYWDVSIEDAISAVGAGDILDGCFDSANYPNLLFCELFTRRADGGLNFLETGQINFAKQEAEGVDFAITYDFMVGDNSLKIRLVGSQQRALDNFFNPLDPTDVNPELEEVQIPKLSGNLYLSWSRGPFNIGWQTQYMSRQSIAEIEDVLGLNGNQAVYGDAGFFDRVTVHDINGSFEFGESLSIYGGVNNIADEEPFANQTGWPVGPRGRTYFIGLTYRQ